MSGRVAGAGAALLRNEGEAEGAATQFYMARIAGKGLEDMERLPGVMPNGMYSGLEASLDGGLFVLGARVEGELTDPDAPVDTFVSHYQP